MNFRIFVARKLNIELNKYLPVKLKRLASITITRATATNVPPEEIVAYSRDVSIKELSGLQEEFDALQPRCRYRGKFSLLFFRHWLKRLVSEFSESGEGIFNSIEFDGKPREGELTLSNFASKSALPSGFEEFVNAIAP